MAFLGIDAGATATKWALYSDGKVTARGKEMAMDSHLYRPESLARFNSVISTILSAISNESVEGILLGITGYSPSQEVEKHLAALVQAPSRVISDIELAYLANFPDSHGILLYAGTGSVAFTTDKKGAMRRIGGWGYLLGDEGAGYWIGREAIRTLMFEIDKNHSLKTGSLSAAIADQMDSLDWAGVKSFVYGRDRSSIADLSRVVGESAAKGDLDAIAILSEAAIALQNLITRAEAVAEVSNSRIIFSGGVSSNPVIGKKLSELYGERLSISKVDIAAAAAELASK